MYIYIYKTQTHSHVWIYRPIYVRIYIESALPHVLFTLRASAVFFSV